MPPVYVTADWHFRNDDPYATYDAKGVSDFLKVRAQMFKRVVRLVLAKSGHLIDVGDFLDATLTDYITMYYASQSVALLEQLPFALLLEGNHGFDAKNSGVSAISHWKHLVPSNVAVVTYPKVVQTSEIDYHCIPPIANISELFPKVARDLLQHLRKFTINILLLHGPIVGALFDSGVPAGTGIKREQLEFVAKHYDRVVCGDFHRYQQILPNAWYCGSPLQTSLKDHGQTKGIQVFSGPGSDHRFLCFAGPRFYKLRWDMDRGPTSLLQHFEQFTTVLRQAVVCLQIRASAAQRSSVDVQELTSWFKNAGALRLVITWEGHDDVVERARIDSGMNDNEMVAGYVNANPPSDLPKDEVVQVGLSYLRP